MRADDARHGKYAGYMAGCKCDPCALANRRYDKTVRMRRLRGEQLTVPIDRARAHMARCVALGMPCEVFAAAGVQSPSRILHGDHGFLHAKTEAAVLSVVPTPGVNWFPTEGAVRRLRALIALGHSQRAIAESVGVTVQHMSMLVTGYRGFNIAPDLWKRIAATYDELAMTVGTSTRSRKRAAANGWAVPFAWDDIDNPAEKPKGLNREGRTTEINATRAADLEHFAHMGDTLETACERLDVNPDTLWKWCNRHGHGDLFERLAERTRRGANQWTEGRRTA